MHRAVCLCAHQGCCIACTLIQRTRWIFRLVDHQTLIRDTRCAIFMGTKCARRAASASREARFSRRRDQKKSRNWAAAAGHAGGVGRPGLDTFPTYDAPARSPPPRRASMAAIHFAIVTTPRVRCRVLSLALTRKEKIFDPHWLAAKSRRVWLNQPQAGQTPQIQTRAVKSTAAIG